MNDEQERLVMVLGMNILANQCAMMNVLAPMCAALTRSIPDDVRGEVAEKVKYLFELVDNSKKLYESLLDALREGE